MRILIDTNVILDIVQKREPFFADSYQALRKAIEADAECLISASAATDIFYMLRKAFQSVISACLPKAHTIIRLEEELVRQRQVLIKYLPPEWAAVRHFKQHFP